MNYIAVNDLKKSKYLHEELVREHELVVTKNGRPCALMIEVEPKTLESTIASVRNAMFASSISHARTKFAELPISENDIESEIKESRKGRNIA